MGRPMLTKQPPNAPPLVFFRTPTGLHSPNCEYRQVQTAAHTIDRKRHGNLGGLWDPQQVGKSFLRAKSNWMGCHQSNSATTAPVRHSHLYLHQLTHAAHVHSGSQKYSFARTHLCRTMVESSQSCGQCGFYHFYLFL